MSMPHELPLRGKLTVNVAGRKLVLAKKAYESNFHVMAKALTFACYVREYPPIIVEPKPVGRYKPDLIVLDEDGGPRFWAECGKTSPDKITWMTNHFRDLRLAFTKRVNERHTFEKILKKSVAKKFSGQIEFLGLSKDLLSKLEGDTTLDLTAVKLEPELIEV